MNGQNAGIGENDSGRDQPCFFINDHTVLLGQVITGIYLMSMVSILAVISSPVSYRDVLSEEVTFDWLAGESMAFALLSVPVVTSTSSLPTMSA